MTKLYKLLTKRQLSLLGFIAAVLYLPISAVGQVSTYSFSKTNIPYAELRGDSILNAEPGGGANADDNNYSNIAVGFPFRYNGSFVSRINVNFNGTVFFVPSVGAGFSYTRIALGAGLGGQYFNQDGAATNSNLGAVAFGSDIRSRVGNDLTISRIGTAPSRALVIQWKNIGRYGANGTSDSFNFQIKLLENGDIIEMAYGACTVGTVPFNVSVGISSARNEFISLTGSDWPSANPTASPTAGMPLSSTVIPPSGTTYRFAPIPPAPNDLAVVGFTSPRADQTSCLLGTQNDVCVQVRNFGTAAQTASPVTYILNGGTAITQQVTFTPAILPGEIRTICFTGTSSADLSRVGRYSFTAYSSLGTELRANQANDTLRNFNINLTGPTVPAPDSIIRTLADVPLRGWAEATGQVTPSGNTSSWITGFPAGFVSETISITSQSLQTGTGPVSSVGDFLRNDWILSPNYTVSPATFLVFKSGVTYNDFGSAPIRRIGTDDTLKVMISTDCGTTWRSLKNFTNASIASREWYNIMNEYRLPIGNAGSSSVRLAFYATSSNTRSDSTYRIHLDDIAIVEVLATDFGATTVLAPLSGQPGCVLSANERVTVRIRNFGSAQQTTVTVGYNVNRGPKREETITLSPALAPGATREITFTAVNSVDLSRRGSYLFRAWTILAGESVLSKRNDTTKSDSIRISAPFALPSPRVKSFLEAATASFMEGVGQDRPSGTVSSWSVGTTPNPANDVVALVIDTNQVPAGQTRLYRDWIYTPTYSMTPTTQLIFKLGVYARTGGAPAPSGVGDDTLYVKISEDCGGLWKTIAKFSQADVTSGRISNRLTEFTYTLPAVGPRASVGFYVDNQGTRTALQYRWALDDIQVKNPSAVDLEQTACLAQQTTC